MKLVFLIADGMGDWPIQTLGGVTPLAAAHTPHMDALAARGLVGLCRTVPQGMPPGSDVANMSLLGFDPATYHTGRGPIEAAAQGLDLAEDDVVWRMNLVTVSSLAEDGVMRDYSAGHIATDKATTLVEDLQKTILDGEGNTAFRMYPGVQYRHLLVQRGAAGSPEAEVQIRPPHDITDKSVAQDLAEFAKSPELARLLYASAARLEANPANDTKATSIWPWGQGKRLGLPSFEQAYGMKGAVVSAVDLVKGLGRAAGMEVLDIPGATGLLDTNYEGKVQAALEFLETGDFVFVHLEGPDECGHCGQLEDKVEAIRRFDERVVAPMLKGLEGKDAAFLVTCDHLTPLAIRTHHADPVPFLLAWPGCAETSGVRTFSEETALSTGLKVEAGHELISWALGKLKG